MFSMVTFALTSLVLVLSCSLTSLVECAKKDDYYSLHQYLFTTLEYQKRVRPVEDDGDSLFVYMRLCLLSVVEVREKDQTMFTNAALNLRWSDEILSWNMTRFGGVWTVIVQQQDVWLPDIVVANSVTSQGQLGYDEHPVRLTDGGDVLWGPSSLLLTACDIVVTYYPFDTQVCYIDFETAFSTNNEIDVNINPVKSISLEDFSENGQWILLETDAENLSDEDSRTKIRFKLLLKRRRTFYIVNIILPVLFLSLTSSTVFALPADAGEKMTIGITVLLAYAVYLSIVSAHLPNTSVSISILAVYLTMLLGITATCVVVSVFILRLHHKPGTEPVSPGYRKIAKFMALMSGQWHSWRSDKPKKNSVAPEYCEPIEKQDKDAKKSTNEKWAEPRDMSLIDPSTMPSMTWKDLANIADWFCFVFFSAVSIMITVAAMLALVIGSELNSPSLNKEKEDNVF